MTPTPRVSVVVAGDGPVPQPAGTDVEVVRSASSAAPAEPGVRRLHLPGAGPDTLLLAGARAARGRHVLLSPAGEPASTTALRALTGAATDDRSLVVLAGGASPDEVADALADGRPVLVPRALARRLERVPHPGADAVATWTELAVAHDLRAVGVSAPAGAAAPAAPDSGPGLAAELDAFARLDPPIRPRSDDAIALVLAARRAVGRLVHRRLAAHEEEHAAFAHAVRRLGLRQVPWPVVNAGRARDLAVLWSFPPTINPSSVVAARRLRERGRVTDVLTQDFTGEPGDPSALRMAAEVLGDVRTMPGPRNEVRWDPTRDFVADVVREYDDLAATRDYRTLYTRAFSTGSHVAGALLRLRHPQLHWVAEFSDPIRFNAYGEHRLGDLRHDALLDELAAGIRARGLPVPPDLNYFTWCEWVAFALADELVFTNANQLDFMLGRLPDLDLAERARAVARAEHHPVPTPDLYAAARSSYAVDPGRTHVAYFGSFYPNRGPGLMLAALERLDLADRDRVQLHVLTPRPDALRAEVVARGLADVIRVGDVLGYLEYLHALTRFDVLLLTDFETAPHYVPNPYLPSKYADYAGSGTRTWAVVEPGSIASGLPAAFHTQVGDVAAMTEVLRTLARETPSPG